MLRCLQKVSSKINFLQQFIFAAFLVVLGHFRLYEEFDDIYPQKPESVTKNTSVTIVIREVISAYDSVAAKIDQKWPLLHQK